MSYSFSPSALTSVIQILFYYFIPESPRWQAANNKEESAKSFIAKYHGNGNAADEIIVIELDEIHQALEIEEHISKTTSHLAFF